MVGLGENGARSLEADVARGGVTPCVEGRPGGGGGKKGRRTAWWTAWSSELGAKRVETVQWAEQSPHRCPHANPPDPDLSEGTSADLIKAN